MLHLSGLRSPGTNRIKELDLLTAPLRFGLPANSANRKHPVFSATSPESIRFLTVRSGIATTRSGTEPIHAFSFRPAIRAHATF